MDLDVSDGVMICDIHSATGTLTSSAAVSASATSTLDSETASHHGISFCSEIWEIKICYMTLNFCPSIVDPRRHLVA